MLVGLSGDDEGGEQVPDRVDTPRFDNLWQQESYPSFELLFDEDEVDFRQAVAPTRILIAETRNRGRTSTSSAVVTATPLPPTTTTARVSAQMEESGLTGGGVGGSSSFGSPIDEIEEFSSQEDLAFTLIGADMVEVRIEREAIRTKIKPLEDRKIPIDAAIKLLEDGT